MRSTIAVAVRHRSNSSFCCAFSGLARLRLILDCITRLFIASIKLAISAVRLRLSAGSMMQPCFYLERTNDNSFRGSIAGLNFAYCDFTRYQGAAQVGRGEHPLSLTADR
jgi:hypothetical protein